MNVQIIGVQDQWTEYLGLLRKRRLEPYECPKCLGLIVQLNH